MSKSNVVSFADKDRERRDKGAFLELIETDLQSNPGCIQPIPLSIFGEIADIQALAEENRRRELLEG